MFPVFLILVVMTLHSYSVGIIFELISKLNCKRQTYANVIVVFLRCVCQEAISQDAATPVPAPRMGAASARQVPATCSAGSRGRAAQVAAPAGSSGGAVAGTGAGGADSPGQ